MLFMISCFCCCCCVSVTLMLDSLEILQRLQARILLVKDKTNLCFLSKLCNFLGLVHCKRASSQPAGTAFLLRPTVDREAYSLQTKLRSSSIHDSAGLIN